MVWMSGKALAAESDWLTSFPDAADKAITEKKVVLLDFTGSDWCGWCMRLDDETFSRAEFLQYARSNAVLVRVDFPRNKSLPGDQKEANQALAKKYAVSGFPTVLIVKPDGTLLWDQRGYAPGGPKFITDAIDQCRKAAGLAIWTKPVAPPSAAPLKTAAAAPVQKPAPMIVNSARQPQLGGILFSASHASVMLDGTYCEVGEAVHGMRVLKIARDGVTVEYQGQVEVLRGN